MTRKHIQINPILLLMLPLLFSGCLKTTNYSALPENMHSGQHAVAQTTSGADSLQVATYNIYLGNDIGLYRGSRISAPPSNISDCGCTQIEEPGGDS